MGRLSKPEKSQSPSQVPSPSLPSNASGRPVAGSRHYASKPRVEATIAPAVAPAFVFGGPSVTTTGIDPTRLHADPLGRGSRSSAAAQTAGVGTFAPRKGTAVAGTTLPAKAESWSTNAEAGPSTQSGETNHKSTVNTASASPHPSVVDPTRPRRMPVMTAAEMAVAKVAAQEGAARDAALRQAVARESAVRAAAAKDVAAGSVTANSGQAIRPGGTATPNTDILANKQSQPQPAQPAANDSNLIGTRCESCKKAKAVILQEAQIDGPDPARARAAIYRCPERTCPAIYCLRCMRIECDRQDNMRYSAPICPHCAHHVNGARLDRQIKVFNPNDGGRMTAAFLRPCPWTAYGPWVIAIRNTRLAVPLEHMHIARFILTVVLYAIPVFRVIRSDGTPESAERTHRVQKWHIACAVRIWALVFKKEMQEVLRSLDEACGKVIMTLAEADEILGDEEMKKNPPAVRMAVPPPPFIMGLDQARDLATRVNTLRNSGQHCSTASASSARSAAKEEESSGHSFEWRRISAAKELLQIADSLQRAITSRLPGMKPHATTCCRLADILSTEDDLTAQIYIEHERGALIPWLQDLITKPHLCRFLDEQKIRPNALANVLGTSLSDLAARNPRMGKSPHLYPCTGPLAAIIRALSGGVSEHVRAMRRSAKVRDPPAMYLQPLTHVQAGASPWILYLRRTQSEPDLALSSLKEEESTVQRPTIADQEALLEDVARISRRVGGPGAMKVDSSAVRDRQLAVERPSAEVTYRYLDKMMDNLEAIAARIDPNSPDTPRILDTITHLLARMDEQEARLTREPLPDDAHTWPLPSRRNLPITPGRSGPTRLRIKVPTARHEPVNTMSPSESSVSNGQVRNATHHKVCSCSSCSPRPAPLSSDGGSRAVESHTAVPTEADAGATASTGHSVALTATASDSSATNTLVTHIQPVASTTTDRGLDPSGSTGDTVATLDHRSESTSTPAQSAKGVQPPAEDVTPNGTPSRRHASRTAGEQTTQTAPTASEYIRETARRTGSPASSSSRASSSDASGASSASGGSQPNGKGNGARFGGFGGIWRSIVGK